MLEQASLEAMVRSLGDPFSHYFSPTEAERFDKAMSNEFEGIGVSVEQERRGLRVLMVFDGSPAKHSGLRKGDVITRAWTATRSPARRSRWPRRRSPASRARRCACAS